MPLDTDALLAEAAEKLSPAANAALIAALSTLHLYETGDEQARLERRNAELARENTALVDRCAAQQLVIDNAFARAAVPDDDDVYFAAVHS